MSNTFLDKDGNLVGPIDFNPTLGRKSAATTRSVNLSNEDYAAIDGIEGNLASLITLATALNGYVDALETLIGSTNTKLDTLNTVVADNTTAAPVQIQSPSDVLPFTPTLDTAAYAVGDVLFSTVALSGVTRANDLRAMLASLTGVDKSKNKPAFTIFFYQTNVASAAANAANNMSDSDAITCLGFVRVAASDWIDLANNSFFSLKNINLMLEAASGTTSVYLVGVLDAGTPTFAAGDMILKFGIVQS